MGFCDGALAGVMHEAGHILFIRCVHAACPGLLPRLAVSACAWISCSPGRQEAAALCAGPLVNFLAAAGMFASAAFDGQLRAVFFAAVHLCMGRFTTACRSACWTAHVCWLCWCLRAVCCAGTSSARRPAFFDAYRLVALLALRPLRRAVRQRWRLLSFCCSAGGPQAHVSRRRIMDR